MLYFIKNRKIKNLLIIVSVYFLTQFFLLIVSGRWWDDWCFYKQSDYALINMSLQMGRPEVIFIMKLIKLFPENFYRILTFVMYFYISIDFYKILVEGMNLDEKDSLYITLIFMCAPINVERIQLCIFSYTLGLFMFIKAFYLFIYVLNINKLYLIKRIAILLMFFVSYTLNSNLFFFGIFLLYIINKEKSVVSLFKYIDFILLPIIFYIIKCVYFTPYGLYENYNTVTLNSLIRGMILVIPSSIFSLFKYFRNLFIYDRYTSLIVFAISLFIIFCYHFKTIFKDIYNIILKKSNNIFLNNHLDVDLKKIMFFLIIGAICLMCGLFPYTVIRQYFQVLSRDLILTPFGLAFIIYALITFTFNSFLKNAIMIIFITFSITFFFINYTKFQNNFYDLKGLQYQFSINTVLKKYKTFLFVYQYEYKDYMFYSLNGAIADVYDTEDRLISTDIDNMLSDSYQYSIKDLVVSENYHINDFDYNYKKIDVIFTYKFNCDLKDTIRLKYYEIFDKDRFIEEIKNRSAMTYCVEGSEQYNDYLKYRDISYLKK